MLIKLISFKVSLLYKKCTRGSVRSLASNLYCFLTPRDIGSIKFKPKLITSLQLKSRLPLKIP